MRQIWHPCKIIVNKLRHCESIKIRFCCKRRMRASVDTMNLWWIDAVYMQMVVYMRCTLTKWSATRAQTGHSGGFHTWIPVQPQQYIQFITVFKPHKKLLPLWGSEAVKEAKQMTILDKLLTVIISWFTFFKIKSNMTLIPNMRNEQFELPIEHRTLKSWNKAQKQDINGHRIDLK